MEADARHSRGGSAVTALGPRHQAGPVRAPTFLWGGRERRCIGPAQPAWLALRVARPSASRLLPVAATTACGWATRSRRRPPIEGHGHARATGAGGVQVVRPHAIHRPRRWPRSFHDLPITTQFKPRRQPSGDGCEEAPTEAGLRGPRCKICTGCCGVCRRSNFAFNARAHEKIKN